MAQGDVKDIYFGASANEPTSLTITALNSLASSATAGWQSDAVDNSSTAYEDVQVQVVVDMANTAPANSKALFVYAYGAVSQSAPAFSNPATGTQGTITLLDVTTTPQNLKLLGTIPYTTADEVIESPPFSIAQVFGNVPVKWGVVIINHTGAAIAASGNSVKWLGIRRNITP